MINPRPNSRRRWHEISRESNLPLSQELDDFIHVDPVKFQDFVKFIEGDPLGIGARELGWLFNLKKSHPQQALIGQVAYGIFLNRCQKSLDKKLKEVLSTAPSERQEVFRNVVPVAENIFNKIQDAIFDDYDRITMATLLPMLEGRLDNSQKKDVISVAFAIVSFKRANPTASAASVSTVGTISDYLRKSVSPYSEMELEVLKHRVCMLRGENTDLDEVKDLIDRLKIEFTSYSSSTIREDRRLANGLDAVLKFLKAEEEAKKPKAKVPEETISPPDVSQEDSVLLQTVESVPQDQSTTEAEPTSTQEKTVDDRKSLIAELATLRSELDVISQQRIELVIENEALKEKLGDQQVANERLIEKQKELLDELQKLDESLQALKQSKAADEIKEKEFKKKIEIQINQLNDQLIALGKENKQAMSNMKDLETWRKEILEQISAIFESIDDFVHKNEDDFLKQMSKRKKFRMEVMTSILAKLKEIRGSIRSLKS